MGWCSGTVLEIDLLNPPFDNQVMPLLLYIICHYQGCSSVYSRRGRRPPTSASGATWTTPSGFCSSCWLTPSAGCPSPFSKSSHYAAMKSQVSSPERKAVKGKAVHFSKTHFVISQLPPVHAICNYVWLQQPCMAGSSSSSYL